MGIPNWLVLLLGTPPFTIINSESLRGGTVPITDRGDTVFRSSSRSSVGILCIAIAVLVIAVAAGSALADGASDDSNPLPSTPDVAGAIDAGTELADESLTDPGAVTGVPLDNLDRDQAQALLSGVFGDVVEAPSGIYDELQEAKVLAPDVAVLPAAGSNPDAETESDQGDGAESEEAPRSADEPPPISAAELAGGSLIQSTVPLQVEDDAGIPVPLDLALNQTEGGLQSIAPLVNVRIPNELGDGVELPDLGITIELVGVPDGRSPTVTDDNAAFFPNVAPDADFAVAPAPSGFETFSQLRDPESPTTQVYKLGLPNGAVLAETDAGGAEVVKDGEKLLAVQPPVAIDAGGSDVPVALGVDGDSLIVSADPPQGAAYPILVDPLWQSYEWAAKKTTAGICSSSTGYEPGGSCEKREEWGYDVLVYPWGGPLHLRASNNWGPAQPGIFVTAEGQQRAGDHAAVIYTVPRYFKESPPPTSFIKKLNVSNVTWQALGASASPYLYMGIWDYVNQGWIQFFSHTGQVEHGINDPAHIYEFENGQPNKNGKVAQVGIWATAASAGSNSRVYAGSAAVELGDTDVPQTPVPSGQSAWGDKAAVPVSFTASDSGLGVYAMNVSTGPNNPSGAYTWKQKQGCVGIGNAACPVTWKSTDPGTPAVTFVPAVLPNGINYVSLVAEDPVGNKSASSWSEVRVDHSAPQVSISGNLTEQSTVGTNLPEYTLNYAASDGDDAPAAAQTPIGTSGTGTGQLERPVGMALDAEGDIWTTDRTQEKDHPVRQDRQIPQRVRHRRHRRRPAWRHAWSGDRSQRQHLGRRSVEPGLHSSSRPAEPSSRRSPTPRTSQAYTASPLGQTAWSGLPIRKKSASTNSKRTAPKFAPSASPSGPAWSRPGSTSTNTATAGSASRAGTRSWRLSPTGAVLTKFGSGGTGDGQVQFPQGITVAPSGNIFLVDDTTNRVQVFESDGTFLRKFGTAGSGNSQFKEPREVVVGADNVAYVSDAGNKRIARWAHADQDPQSGAAKVQVKVDGVAASTKEPGCTSKNCAISGSWTLKADDYAGGAHKVEVIATDAVGIAETKMIECRNPRRPHRSGDRLVRDDDPASLDRHHQAQLQTESRRHRRGPRPQS